MSNISISSLLTLYLLAINVVTFLLYGIDKWRAKRARWRMPEGVLLGLEAIGGSVGAWLGMGIWHHKTQHKKFRYGVPVMLLIQIALLVWFWKVC